MRNVQLFFRKTNLISGTIFFKKYESSLAVSTRCTAHPHPFCRFWLSHFHQFPHIIFNPIIANAMKTPQNILDNSFILFLVFVVCANRLYICGLCIRYHVHLCALTFEVLAMRENGERRKAIKPIYISVNKHLLRFTFVSSGPFWMDLMKKRVLVVLRLLSIPQDTFVYAWLCWEGVTFRQVLRSRRTFANVNFNESMRRAFYIVELSSECMHLRSAGNSSLLCALTVRIASKRDCAVCKSMHTHLAYHKLQHGISEFSWIERLRRKKWKCSRFPSNYHNIVEEEILYSFISKFIFSCFVLFGFFLVLDICDMPKTEIRTTKSYTISLQLLFIILGMISLQDWALLDGCLLSLASSEEVPFPSQLKSVHLNRHT